MSYELDLRVEEPPEPATKSGGTGRAPDPELVKVVESLKENVEEWHRVVSTEKRQQAQSFAYRARHGKLAAFQPVGHFEVVARPLEDDSGVVYARYLGDDYEPSRAEKLAAQSRAELVRVCQEHGLATSGSRQTLAARIVEYEGPGAEDEDEDEGEGEGSW